MVTVTNLMENNASFTDTLSYHLHHLNLVASLLDNPPVLNGKGEQRMVLILRPQAQGRPCRAPPTSSSRGKTRCRVTQGKPHGCRLLSMVTS